MALFIVKFLQPRVTPYLSGPNILVCIQLPNVPHLRCLNVTDHILHPYKTNGKNVVSSILTLCFFEKTEISEPMEAKTLRN